jgi:hypothetical protein
MVRIKKLQVATDPQRAFGKRQAGYEYRHVIIGLPALTVIFVKYI